MTKLNLYFKTFKSWALNSIYANTQTKQNSKIQYLGCLLDESRLGDETELTSKKQ